MYRWLVWNVLFRLHEAAKRHPTHRILRAMRQADRLTPGELEQLQQNMLQEFLAHCQQNVPYVRTMMHRAGVKPAQIRRPEDLPLLPLMAKEVVRRERQNLRSSCGKLAQCSTGGSTGNPLIFDLDKRRIASRVACRQRVSRWWGMSLGDSEIALWGSPVELTRQDRIRSMRDWMFSTRLLSAFEMNDATMSRYLDILERQRCRQIFAYPSAIYHLCLRARKEGRNLRELGIQVVFVTGEVLFPYQRELIVNTLNCPVANGYGGRDSGFIAHECPRGGMHVMADAVIVEIVDADGRVLPAGEMGEIVITDLYSHGAPFIRYRTGDLGVLSTKPCSCGLALPTLESIEGRSNDSVITPDGRLINSLALVYPVREVEGIDEFRIIQKSETSFRVQVVANQSFDRSSERHILASWEKLFRSPLDVTFEYSLNLPSDPSGKFRHVTSELWTRQSGRNNTTALTPPLQAVG